MLSQRRKHSILEKFAKSSVVVDPPRKPPAPMSLGMGAPLLVIGT